MRHHVYFNYIRIFELISNYETFFWIFSYKYYDYLLPEFANSFLVSSNINRQIFSEYFSFEYLLLSEVNIHLFIKNIDSLSKPEFWWSKWKISYSPVSETSIGIDRSILGLSHTLVKTNMCTFVFERFCFVFFRRIDAFLNWRLHGNDWIFALSSLAGFPFIQFDGWKTPNENYQRERGRLL